TGARCYLSPKDWLDVALKKVVGDVRTDSRFIGLERVQVADTHLGRYLEAYVDELANIRVVVRAILFVAKRVVKLLGIPAINFLWCGKLAAIDIDDGRVGSGQFVKLVISFGVDFLCDFETFATGLG